MEEAILFAIQQLTGLPWLDNFMIALSLMGDNGLVWIIVTLVLLARRETRCYGLVCACALLLSLLLCNVLLKNLVARPRPYEMFEWLRPLVALPKDLSFPSGHASSSFAAATAMLGLGKKWSAPAYMVAFLIAFSRLYVGVHYFTDVLAGMLLGIFCGWLAQAIVRRFFAYKY